MREYLRDFINENVGPECGGVDGGTVVPGGITNKLNEILKRLDRLEAGIGFTADMQDSVVLNSTGGGISIPVTGTLHSVIMSLTSGGKNLVGAHFDLYNEDGGKRNSYSWAPIIDSDTSFEPSRTQTFVVSWPVYAGDYLLWSCYPSSWGGNPDEPANSTDPICSLLINLPPKTITINRS